MIFSSGRLRRSLFGISLEEASFARRRFREGQAGTRRRLERIGQTFLGGYHAALEHDTPSRLTCALEAVEAELRGFAYEGAAMGLALRDTLTPWNRGRLQAFLAGPGAAHVYMAHVGAGWVLARLRRSLARPPTHLDPLLGWLALDGYGFHEGYFHWPRFVEEKALPTRLSGYARRVFDQGLGRSLWFVEGADVRRIPATIAAFPGERPADLWSGVGLACAYAGGVERADLEALRRAAGEYLPEMAQGAAFAAEARRRAGNPAEHTEAACRILCACSADEAAGITEKARVDLPQDAAEPAYALWRRRIRDSFVRAATMPPVAVPLTEIGR